MLLRFAVGIGSTQKANAGADAAALQTGKIAGTVVVAEALALRCSGLQDAATLVGIAGEALGTDALVAALLVDAVSSIGAGQVSALILVRAAQQGISLESCFAHALRRI